LSPGDYCGNNQLAKLFFKYFYNQDEEEISESIKEKVDNLEIKSLVDGLKVLEKLSSINVRFYGVRGNWDPLNYEFDIGSPDKKHKEFGLKRFNKKFKNKKLNGIDFKIIELRDFILVGGGSSTSPGKINKTTLRKIHQESENRGEAKKLIKLRIQKYRKRENKYFKIFEKAQKLKNKTSKPIIFLTHNCPYGTKVDKIISKKAPKRVRGKHYGSYLEKNLIKKYQPDLVICGHMHEGFGKTKSNKTVIVNSGSVFNKQYVLFEIKNKKIKNIKLKKLNK
jgi:Icc-related predicted phosphoesterase